MTRVRASSGWASARDVLSDTLIDLGGRIGRTVLLIAAVSLAISGIVVGVGLGQITNARVSDQLAQQIGSTITVSAADASRGDDSQFTSRAVQNALALPWVVCGGMVLEADPSIARIQRLPGSPPSNVSMVGVTSGYVCALGADRTGLDSLDVKGLSSPPVWVGVDAAVALSLPAGVLNGGLTVTAFDGSELLVAGVLGRTNTYLDRVVLAPYSFVQGELQEIGHARLTLRTLPGAGSNTADVVASALSATTPGQFQVTRVDALTEVRSGVGDSLRTAVLTSAVALTLVVAFVLSATMMASVAHRTSEIGLRRSLGFSRVDVLITFLTEGFLVGLVGGASGGATGAAAVTAIALLTGVGAPPLLWAFPLGFLLGAFFCTLAAMPPAIRAATIRPATALRAE